MFPHILIVQRSSLLLSYILLLCCVSGQCRAQSDSRSRSSSSNFIDEEDEEDGVMWPTLTISPYHHDDDHEHQQQAGGSKYSGPFFEPVFPTNLSVLAGQTVVLQCRVMDLGDRVVLYIFYILYANLLSNGIKTLNVNQAHISLSFGFTS